MFRSIRSAKRTEFAPLHSQVFAITRGESRTLSSHRSASAARRRADGLQKRYHQRHETGLQSSVCRCAKPVFNRPIDQERQRASRYFGRPSGRQPVPFGGQRNCVDEELLHRRIGAFPTLQGGQHLADVFAAQPQDRENAAAFGIGFECPHSLTDRVRQLVQRIAVSARSIYKPTSTNSLFASTVDFTRSMPFAPCSASRVGYGHQPTTNSIPAIGSTLHAVAVCLNRIVKQ